MDRTHDHSIAERPSARTRLILNLVALGVVAGAVTLSWLTFETERFVALKVLAVTTFVALGKFVVLVPIWEDGFGFSPFFLAGMVATMDVVTALFIGANMDVLYRLRWAGPRLSALEGNGRRVLQRRPWMRNLAMLGVMLFVTFPLTGTGAIGGTVLGRLVGLRLPRILLGIALGACAGAFGLALGADALADVLGEVREKLWFKLLGIGVVTVFVVGLVWQGLRVQPAEPLETSADGKR